MAYKIDIIGDISGWYDGVGYDRMQSELDRAGSEDVEIRMHSGGGSVVEGFAIRNALQNHKGKVSIHVMGLAASIASVILTGADEVTMQEGSTQMIHRATLWPHEPMNAEQAKNKAKTLELFDGLALDSYVLSAKSNNKLKGGSEEKARANFKKLVDAETWITAKEAVELGLATRIIEPQQTSASASFSATLKHYKNIPQEIKNKYMPEGTEEIKDEKVSLGFVTKLINSLGGLFNNKIEEVPPIDDKALEIKKEDEMAKEKLTNEEMIAALKKDGYTIEAKKDDTPPVVPVVKKEEDKAPDYEAQIKVLTEGQAKMLEIVKGLEAKIVAPSGESTTKVVTTESALDKVISAQVEN